MIGPADALFGDASGAPRTTPIATAARTNGTAQALKLFRIYLPSPEMTLA
jgi:hypothetical protein